MVLKALLLIFNIVFILVGIALIAIGIWTAADKIYVSSIIGDTLFSAASYLAIVVGVITACVNVLGIYAIAKDHLRLLMLFLATLVLSAVLMLVGGILAVVFKTEMEGAMVDQMRKTLINGYGSDSGVTDAWDKVQKELECCAISATLVEGGSNLYIGPYADNTEPIQEELPYQDSWPIYKRTEFFRQQNGVPIENKLFVPESCCVIESNQIKNQGVCQNFNTGPPSNYKQGHTNYFLNDDGCYNKAKAIILDQTDILLGFGFAFSIIMIAEIVLTFLLVRQFSNEEDIDIKRRREPDNL